jgi:hypothetical protein
VVFPDDGNFNLASAADQDVVTQHRIESVLQKLEETL